MEITEKRTVEEVKEVLVGRKCDFCGKMVDMRNWFRVRPSCRWGCGARDAGVRTEAGALGGRA